VVWLKLKALSSNFSITKTKKGVSVQLWKSESEDGGNLSKEK
jgi:hypothetical protein